MDPWIEGCVLRDRFSKFYGSVVDREVSIAEMYGSNERWVGISMEVEKNLISMGGKVGNIEISVIWYGVKGG